MTISYEPQVENQKLCIRSNHQPRIYDQTKILSIFHSRDFKEVLGLPESSVSS